MLQGGHQPGAGRGIKRSGDIGDPSLGVWLSLPDGNESGIGWYLGIVPLPPSLLALALSPSNVSPLDGPGRRAPISWMRKVEAHGWTFPWAEDRCSDIIK